MGWAWGFVSDCPLSVSVTLGVLDCLVEETYRCFKIESSPLHSINHTFTYDWVRKCGINKIPKDHRFYFKYTAFMRESRLIFLPNSILLLSPFRGSLFQSKTTVEIQLYPQHDIVVLQWRLWWKTNGTCNATTNSIEKRNWIKQNRYASQIKHICFSSVQLMYGSDHVQNPHVTVCLLIIEMYWLNNMSWQSMETLRVNGNN